MHSAGHLKYHVLDFLVFLEVSTFYCRLNLDDKLLVEFQ
jgi:hypothetical protein